MVLTIGSRYKISILIPRGDHKSRSREISKDMMLQESCIKARYLKSDLAGRDQLVSKCSQLITSSPAILLEGLINRWLKRNAAALQPSKTE